MEKALSYYIRTTLIILAVLIGWLVALTVMYKSVALASQGNPFSGAMASFALVGGALNHGFWQIVSSVMVITDEARRTRKAAETVAAAIKQDAFDRKATDGPRG